MYYTSYVHNKPNYKNIDIKKILLISTMDNVFIINL